MHKGMHAASCVHFSIPDSYIRVQVSDPAISALLQVGAMQGLVNSSNRPSKAECMSDRRLTSRSTDKDLEGTQDHAVKGPGQTRNGAGAWPLQCEAQPAVPVLTSQKSACVSKLACMSESSLQKFQNSVVISFSAPDKQHKLTACSNIVSHCRTPECKGCLHLSCDSQPLVKARQAQATSTRVAVVHHQCQVTVVKLMVCGNFAKVPDTRLHNVLQHSAQGMTIRLNFAVSSLEAASSQTNGTAAYLAEGMATTLEPLHKESSVLDMDDVELSKHSTSKLLVTLLHSECLLLVTSSDCDAPVKPSSEISVTVRIVKRETLTLLTHLSSRRWQIAAGGIEQVGAHFLWLRGISLLLAFLVEVSQLWRGGSAAPSHREKVGLDCKLSVEEAQARSAGTDRSRGPACSNSDCSLPPKQPTVVH